MKKTLSMFAVSLLISFLILQVVAPVNIYAQSTSNQSSGCTSGGSSSGDGINNPLRVNSIQCLISEGLKFVVNLLAIAGVVYIIWTGFLFVKARGNEKELETAKKSFFNAIIGMAIILGAWAIATAIANTINQVTNNNNATLGTS